MNSESSFTERIIQARDDTIKWVNAFIPSKAPEEKKELEPFINFKKRLGYFIFGEKGSGKSSIGAWLAEQYYKEGYVIFDCYSEVDYENCFWVVKRKAAYPCIFIIPRYVQITIPDEYKQLVKVMYDDEGIDKLLSTAQKEKRILVFVNSAYDEDHSREVLAGFFNDLPRVNTRLNILTFILIRELAHLAPEGLMLSATAKITKKALLRFVLGCRHFYFNFSMDIQSLKNAFSSLRKRGNRVIIKQLDDDEDLPKALKWFNKKLAAKQAQTNSYKEFPNLEKLYPREYYGLYPTKDFFKGSFPLPKFHLKGIDDNFQLMTGITFDINKEKMDEVLNGKVIERINPRDIRLFKSAEKMKVDKVLGRDIAKTLGFKNKNSLNAWKMSMKKKFNESNIDIDKFEDNLS